MYISLLFVYEFSFSLALYDAYQGCYLCLQANEDNLQDSKVACFGLLEIFKVCLCVLCVCLCVCLCLCVCVCVCVYPLAWMCVYVPTYT